MGLVMATQSINSLVPPLGREKAEVLRLNLRNRLIFQGATEADAQDAADFLGKRLRRKVTWNVGRGGRSRSYVRDEAHRVLPHVFRLLKNHECVVVRADKRFRRCVLPPARTGWERVTVVSVVAKIAPLNYSIADGGCCP